MIIKGQNMAYEVNGQLFHCAIDVTMKYIGGKWKAVVLWYLKNVTLRFSELKKRIPDITEKMLTLQLKALEQDGLIRRTASGSKPPLKVEYTLTAFGKSMIEAVNALAKWGRYFAESEGRMVSVKES